MENQKTNILNKKIERISKDNQSSIQGKHNKFSLDNIAKKFKVQFLNFLVFFVKMLIQKYLKEVDNLNNNNIFLQPIKVIYKENVTKEFNVDFLNQKVYIILSLNSKNIKIIKKFFFNEEFNKIMNMKLIDIIQTIFLIKPKEFEEKYGYKNQFLFQNLNKDKEIFKKMQIILNKEQSLLTYFEEIKERKLKKTDFYQSYKISVKRIENEFEEYKLIQNNNNINMMKEFLQILDKENQQNLIKDLNLPLNE